MRSTATRSGSSSTMRMRGLPFGMGCPRAKGPAMRLSVARPDSLSPLHPPAQEWVAANGGGACRPPGTLAAGRRQMHELRRSGRFGSGVEIADADLQPEAPGGQALDRHRDELPPQGAGLLLAPHGGDLG